MPRKVVRKERGVYEKVPGSGIWWIRFKVARGCRFRCIRLGGARWIERCEDRDEDQIGSHSRGTMGGRKQPTCETEGVKS